MSAAKRRELCQEALREERSMRREASRQSLLGASEQEACTCSHLRHVCVCGTRETKSKKVVQKRAAKLHLVERQVDRLRSELSQLQAKRAKSTLNNLHLEKNRQSDYLQ